MSRLKAGSHGAGSFMQKIQVHPLCSPPTQLPSSRQMVARARRATDGSGGAQKGEEVANRSIGDQPSETRFFALRVTWRLGREPESASTYPGVTRSALTSYM